MAQTDEIPTTRTVTLEPHWPGVRRWLRAIYASGETAEAERIDADLNRESVACHGGWTGTE